MANLNEARTRKELIDPQLQKAGWDVNNPNMVGLEIPINDLDPKVWAAQKARLQKVAERAGIYNSEQLPPGISDYVLYRSNGEILAIVEAKRTSIDPRLAQTQAEFYISHLEKKKGQSFRPFAFMTNGKEIYFLDPETSQKRPVAGFFSQSDLENLLMLRTTSTPLSQAPINLNIAGRLYQQEAIRRVCEAFEKQKKRKALLVMATGTGKTRTTMGLIDLLLRTNQARQVLFVADRDALVKQAMNEGFRVFLPGEPCERIYTHKSEHTSRLYVSTLQTLNACFQSFTPGFFDLIIFDEVHRSIFNKWSEVLQYFDARIVGLTATPADFIDRSTFLTFECDNKVPTYLYTYQQAVQDGFLVDYHLYQAQTKFQRKGLKGVDLSEEERNLLIERGIDPDEIEFDRTDLEKNVSNRDTLRRQWQEIMDVCQRDQSGQEPGKTIVFAMTQKHALRLAEVFDEMYPQFAGMTRVITHTSDHKGTLIDHFKQDNYPRIAITVDLLETGIDVPEVVNLVFMKPVQSRIKLEQMIGRGTRCNAACKHPEWLPDGEKKDFLIMDFWENDFNKSASEELAQSMPVLVTLFNTRLKLLEHYLENGQTVERDTIIAKLREQIEHIPVDSYSVKKMLDDLETVKQDHFWLYLTHDKLELLRLKIGPLLRYAAGVDVEATTFTSKVERLKLQIATGKNPASTAQSIAEDASRLPNFVFEDPQCKQAIQLCLSQDLIRADANEHDRVIDTLAPQMSKRRDRANPFLELDIPDFVETRGYILLKGGTERVYITNYRELVEERILHLIDTNDTLNAIDRGEEVTDEQLIELERTLHHRLGESEIELSEENIQKAFAKKVGSLLEFLREVFDLKNIPNYSDIVRRQFAAYVAAHNYNSDQIRFLSAVQNVFLKRGRLQRADLYGNTFKSFGKDAVERLFTSNQIEEIIALANKLAA